jgi:hypothetical protein
MLILCLNNTYIKAVGISAGRHDESRAYGFTRLQRYDKNPTERKRNAIKSVFCIVKPLFLM